MILTCVVSGKLDNRDRFFFCAVSLEEFCGSFFFFEVPGCSTERILYMKFEGTEFFFCAVFLGRSFCLRQFLWEVPGRNNNRIMCLGCLKG